ncbi:uncharacterized protein YMR196W-like [Haliotis rufescens]|uniref:uncharacterized protein YMR196W-like n=1 Tax=Haliotis rufescens TaxID=6454 RepID=UPI00201ED54A|nr:uncharacterized protein YMR196W-like [Haliotis rufescens]
MAAERKRLKEDKLRSKNWKRWGAYLSERQWSTVREDYSEDGNCWDYFPHDHARSRAYRWGEDGLMGITDRQCRMCFALALWNGKDSILKERLFGLTSSQGNHGEDVKELYYYLDNMPTHAYMKMLYKYPQDKYPYSDLVHKNAARTVKDPEYEVLDTGVFDNNRYWDVLAEYCKASPNDILGRFTISNRGSTSEVIHFLPTLWFRNVWSFGKDCDSWMEEKPCMSQEEPGKVRCEHGTLGTFFFEIDKGPSGESPEIIFTENETNNQRIYNTPNTRRYVKDAFHNYVIRGDKDAVNEANRGTKCAAHYSVRVGAGEHVTFRMRLYCQNEAPPHPISHDSFNELFSTRIKEADAFYDDVIVSKSPVERMIARQAYAGLLCSKQFYCYIVKEWLKGDCGCACPPARRLKGRNSDWTHLFNRDIIAMPDKWEYPWYASWDLAFHMIVFANIDIHFAKEQLVLFLREWYMHPNGQMPAYEFALDDVNPPVHAYAVLRVYKKSGPRGQRDLTFLARCFHKLVINFTWWVNRKDPSGNNIFTGGFLGLDNIGVFDRSKPLPTGGVLAQADATAWMGFFSVIMMQISLILAKRDPIYEDMASKFFEHFIAIVDAMNRAGTGEGLWNERDGFYYDHIHAQDIVPLRIRSVVGMIPLFTCFVLDETIMKRHPGFSKRTKWFMDHRKDLSSRISFMVKGEHEEVYMLSMVTRKQISKMLEYILDEEEFLSPYGIRSLSKYHKDNPFVFSAGHESFSVDYEPGESSTNMFGGNSNWRGPIWLPMNYILIETLHRYDYFFGDTLQVECPTRSGRYMRLRDVARELSGRISRLFLPDLYGNRASHGEEERYAKDPNFKDLLLFYEYFHGDTGKGLGASHQTGWSALIVDLMEGSHKTAETFDSTSSLSGNSIY